MSIRKFVFLLTLCCSGFVNPFPSMAQVNLQTGSAVFSLPIFNWQDDKSRLTSIIGLSYSSGNGLKVNDIPSNEGQGWSMVAGGVITRIQAGQPDDQKGYSGVQNEGPGSDQDLTRYPNGYLYATIPIENGCPDALTQYPIYGAQNEVYAQHNDIAQDREMDRFAFQFNGKSGMFVIDTTGGWHGVTIGDSKMQISIQVDTTMAQTQGIRTTITSFTITDVDGLIYKFTRHGLTKLLTSAASSADGSKPATEPKISTGGKYCRSAFDNGPTGGPWINQNMSYPFIISNWYLSEIDDPFTTREVRFTYDSLNLTNAAGSDISYYQGIGSDSYVYIDYKKSVTKAMEIDSVIFPDGHVAKFDYATNSRFDFPGEKALSDVTITYNNRYLSQYRLNTTYFILNGYGTPSDSYEQGVCRLCLRSVTKIGPDLKEDSPPYQFDYYLGSNNLDDYVPPPFCYAKDIWGYYNGYNSVDFNGSTMPLNAPIPYDLTYDQLRGLCYRDQGDSGSNYNAKPGYAQNGLLKQVIYPTGGSLTYQYAQNTGSFIATHPTVRNVGGVHVSKTSSSDGGYSNGCGTPVTTQYNYVVNGPGSASSLWGLEAPDDSMASNNSWEEEKKTLHFSFESGLICKWHYVYPGILSQYESVSLGEAQAIMNIVSNVLGVLSVLGTIDDVVNIINSFGFWTLLPVVLDVVTTVVGLAITCGQKSQNTSTMVFYSYDLNLVAPLPVQFKRVEITESSGGIGKTVEEFTQGDVYDSGGPDYALWHPEQNAALAVKQRYAPWAYGLPKLITVYDVNGNKIKETQNIYDYEFAQEPVVGGSPCCNSQSPASYKCQIINSSSQRNDDWDSKVKYDANWQTTTPQNPAMYSDLYYTYTGRVNLTTTYERTYRTTDATQFVQTETDYSYNDGYDCNVKLPPPACGIGLNYDVKEVRTVQSNGDVYYKDMQYPTDFNSGILATLVQKNIVSLPVATQSYVRKAGGGAYYLNEKVTEFTQLADQDVKPYRTIEQRFATPASNFTGYNGPANTDYANYKITEVFTYDGNSNLVGVQDEGNRNVTNIYSYNDKYIVASVINANALLDKPAYTSFEDTSATGLSRSGWTLTGTASYNINAPSETGVNNFTLQASGSNALSASGLNTATAYILSFWASNSNVRVTGGATLAKSAPTYNGFTYYEYNIAAGTSGVSVKSGSGAVNIDELRLYPAGARMRTTTYDPLLGKTSECDENNRITYYTYDNLGREQFIEDETHNIVKMFEYNNVSAAKQTGCPGSYSNHLLTEPVTRSNCGAGYQGGAATYSIPAGQFTSSISQQDADIQAEIYFLQNAQNYANTNGACSLIYYNIAESQIDTTQTCAEGLKGGLVTYSVPAATYSSIISQDDANQQALDDIAANAQWYANLPSNAVCVMDTAADWEWNPGDEDSPTDPYYCLSVNGQLPPHQFIQLTDENPNSPTYNQKMWVDNGPSSSCPANTYYNAAASQTFIKNNCGSGYAGTAVTYTVPAGKYSSTVSQAAADAQAASEISANGQSDANTNGSCAQIATISYQDFSTTYNFSVQFTNTGAGIVYDYPSIVANSLGAFQVPAGTYNISICPTNDHTTNHSYYVFNLSQTNVQCGTFNNVSVTIPAAGDIELH